MDLKLYYQKIRDTEARIEDEFPVVMSLETPDGGRPGILTEVSRRIAAKMLVDGTAQLTSPEQRQEFQRSQAEARRVAEHLAAAAQVRLTVLSTAELDQLREPRPGATE